jgi:phosphatidylglycerol---prolipoprotein diacylglyceryl transferase
MSKGLVFMFEWAASGHLSVTSTEPAVLFAIGPFVLRYYALSYLFGILGAWWLLKRMLTHRSHAPFTPQQADDFILFATIGIILGGRLGYVLFYKLDEYLGRPGDIFKIWEGGMSFHGGMLGVILAIALFTRSRKLDWVRFHDYVVCSAPVGLLTGRLANFINGELWGAPTQAPWGVIFYTDPARLPRHPTQLYEAWMEGLVLLVLLAIAFWRTEARLKRGFLSGCFLLGYGIFRFLIEYVRVADAHLIGKTGVFHMGQWLCIPMILAGLFLIVRARRIA